MTSPHLDTYQRRLEDLLARLNDFEVADVIRHKDVSRLVDDIAWFMKAVPLASLLGGLTNQDMDPTARTRLLSCLSKVARYRECARFLCRKAQQIPMLRKTVVQKVLRDAALVGNTFPLIRTGVNLEQSLRRFQYMGRPVEISSLPEWLRKTAVASQMLFSDDVEKIGREAKVHAEIQLLAHYDRVSDDVVPPRVLASSKDACSLCSSTIRLHGKYELPKSHGKLYRKWRLPAMYQEGPLQRDLNHFLEGQISATLQTLIALTKRPLMSFLNESTIFPINVSASTLAGPPSTTISNISSSEIAALVQNVGENDTESEADHKLSGTECVKECHVEELELPMEDDAKDQMGITKEPPYVASNDIDSGTGSNDTSATTDNSMTSNPQLLAEEILEPGQTIEFQPAATTRSYFRTKSINLFIDELSSKFYFERLSEADAKVVLRANTHAVTDIELASPGVDVTLTKDVDGRTYVKNGKEVIMIRALETRPLSL